MYWKYLKYILQHKWYVFLECIKRGMFIHAITHDLSKFLPKEFIPYAKYFYGTPEQKSQKWFDMAWENHKRLNKHHWDHWMDYQGKPILMERKYVRQMICDWEAMGIKFGDSTRSYYLQKGSEMKLHPKTKYLLHKELKIEFKE